MVFHARPTGFKDGYGYWNHSSTNYDNHSTKYDNHPSAGTCADATQVIEWATVEAASYVLQGSIGALLGDSVAIGKPGDLIFKPRNQWHTEQLGRNSND